MSDILEDDSAEAAFRALTLKVDGLSVQLSRLDKLARRTSVDPAPALAALNEEIGAVKGALVALVRSPALQMNSEAFRADLANVRAQTRSEMQRELQAQQNELAAAARDVRSALVSARTREQQDIRLLQVGAGALALGAILWVTLSGPLARTLPTAWAVPEKMAARTLDADRWAAGGRMMASARPDDWRGLERGASLVKANAAQLEKCDQQARIASRAVRCTIMVTPREP